MIAGVNFDPAQQGQGMGPSRAGTPPSGVQEAIKVLSLRLPKVVGARSIAPQALLSSPGSGGGRVDSVVNQVLSRYFPTGQTQTPTATMPSPQAPQAPSLQGWMPQPAYGQPQTQAPPSFAPSSGQSPNIRFENPAPPNMSPPEWNTPHPPPPPGWDGTFPSPPPFAQPLFEPSPAFQMPEI